MNVFELSLRLLVAAVLGGIIGLEREFHHKAAGLRTQILICVGAALFTIVSIDLGASNGTPDRIAAQIVTGIGFLGGGAILRSGMNISGLTTAATIWVNAAIGTAAGAGKFDIATAAAVVTLVVLALLPPLERYVDRHRGGSNAEDSSPGRDG